MRADCNYTAVVVFGMSRKELYQMSAGLFYDMIQLHSNRQPKQNTEFD